MCGVNDSKIAVAIKMCRVVWLHFVRAVARDLAKKVCSERAKSQLIGAEW